MLKYVAKAAVDAQKSRSILNMNIHEEFDYAKDGPLLDPAYPTAPRSAPPPVPKPARLLSKRDVSPLREDEIEDTVTRRTDSWNDSSSFHRHDSVNRLAIRESQNYPSQKAVRKHRTSSGLQESSSSQRETPSLAINLLPSGISRESGSLRITSGNSRIVLAVDYGTTYTGMVHQSGCPC